MANIPIDKIAPELNQINKETKELTSNLSNIIKQLDGINKSIAKSKGLKDVNENLNKTKKAQNEIEKAGNSLLAKRNKAIALQDQSLRALTKDQIKQNEKLKEQNRLLREQAREELGIKKRSGLFKSMTKSILAAGAAFLSLQAAFRLFVNSIKTVANFEEAMDKVAAVTGAVASDFSALQKNAMELGATTSRTATQVAGLQLEFAKLGFSTQEILNATEATISLSIAAGEDLAGSAVVAASTVRGFGLDAADTQKVVDVMAKSFASSALDLEKFKTAMAIVAPVAKASGKDIEFATAQISVLADAGLDASTAGTSLRNMFLELNKQGLTWEEGLQKINESTNKNVTALDLFGKRGATAALILADNTQKAELLEQSYDKAAGSAAEMARVMEDNLIGDTKILSSAWEGLVLTLGSKLTPALRNIVKGLTEFITGVNNAVRGTEEYEDSLEGINRRYKETFKEVHKVTLELEKEFEALKRTNEGSESRLLIINRINDQYGDYLPNLLNEKTTLQEIEIAQRAASKALIDSILIKQKDAELQAIREKQAENEIFSFKELAKTYGLTVEQIQKAFEVFRQGSESFFDLQSQQWVDVDGGLTQLEKVYNKSFAGIRESFKNLDVIVSGFEEQTQEVEKLYGILDGGTKTINENTKATDENTKAQKNNNKVLKDKINIWDRISKAVKANEELIRKENEETQDFLTMLVNRREKENLEAADRDLKIEEQRAANIQRVRQESLQYSIDIANGLFELGQTQRDSELAEIERNYKTRIDAAEGNAIVQKSLENELNSERERIAKEQARSERNQALFNIAIQTAQNVVEAFPNPFLIALATTLGLTQAAIVRAQPIPGFFKGTEDAPAGLAWVAERGRELVELNSGQNVLVEKPTLMNFEGGEKVKTNQTTEQLLNKAIYNDIAINGNQGIEKRLDALTYAVKNQTKEVTAFDENGIQRYLLSKGGSITKVLNKSVRK